MNRIVVIASSLSYGGAEKMLCFVANELARRNSVTVINLLEHSDNAGRLDKNIEIKEIKTTNIRFLDRVEQLIKLKKSIREIQPDIIIAFKFLPNFLSSLIGKALRIPVIISERSDPSREIILKGRSLFYWKIINQAAGGVFQTNGAMKYYSEQMQKRGIVIPNPVFITDNISHVVRDNSHSRIIVSVGRISNVQKRYDVMLLAFKRFIKQHPDYILKIYGDGEDTGKVQKWIAEYQLENVVSLEGRTNRPLQAINNGDIFLTTSDYEGISNSLLEAMAIGMPVVATDCTPGGARLLIKDGKNGLLVPCGDIEMIANALDRLAQDYQLRCALGNCAKKVNEEYSESHIADLWENYVDEVIQRSKKQDIVYR